MELFAFNLVLITLLLSLIINYGRTPTQLYCGIFGFSGRNGKKADLKKLLILGLYNRSRGTDSCGYYYNGNIVKGIDKEADFKDFVINNKFVSGDLPYETVMAHTRKSTYGQHTLENAHPHRVENYVQTHNGTLKNIWSLCGKHGVSHAEIHVDSKGLAAIIQKDGFKVLEEYEGYAALTMVFMDDPASLYLYHGASREKENEKTIWEERPLFTLRTNEGLYYSSMPESLSIINTLKTEKPEILPHNEVYLIQNGEIIKSVYDVPRTEMNITKTYVYNSNTPAIQKKIDFQSTKNVTIDTPTDVRLFHETEPIEYVWNDVYYRYGRHFCTVASQKNGVYATYEALLNGVYTINRENKILEENETTNSKYEKYYFIRGVMMQNKKAYETCLKKHKNIEYDIISNIAYCLSEYTRYPVTSFAGEAGGVAESLKNIWFENFRRYTGTITPKFTQRKYIIKKGNLLSIHGDANEITIDTKNIDTKNIVIDSKHYEHKPTDPPGGEEEMSAEDFYNYLRETIDEWCDKIIKPDDVEQIPEVVLLYMEHYNKRFQIHELTADQQLEELNTLLSGLINNQQTFVEYTTLLNNKDWVGDDKNIKECFKNYNAAQLIELENRYRFVDFALDIEAEEVKPAKNDICNLPAPKKSHMTEDETKAFNDAVEKEQRALYVKQIENKISELEDIATSLQQLSSDAAQDEAYKIYITAGKLTQQLQDFNTKS